MDDFLALPDFDEDDEPEVEGHILETPTDAAEAADPDDDVEGHGQSPFR